MDNDNVMDFYTKLGFEETVIEDNLTALAVEIDSAGSYALLTDEEGTIPAGLRQRIIFAYYSAEGAYQWSISFKNSFLFKDIWSETLPPADNFQAVQKHRESREALP